MDFDYLDALPQDQAVSVLSRTLAYRTYLDKIRDHLIPRLRQEFDAKQGNIISGTGDVRIMVQRRDRLNVLDSHGLRTSLSSLGLLDVYRPYSQALGPMMRADPELESRLAPFVTLEHDYWFSNLTGTLNHRDVERRLWPLVTDDH